MVEAGQAHPVFFLAWSRQMLPSWLAVGGGWTFRAGLARRASRKRGPGTAEEAVEQQDTPRREGHAFPALLRKQLLL